MSGISVIFLLKFTIERESDYSLPFLDMKITRKNNILLSVWYTKPTDTGLMMNFHALAPIRYKRSAVIGLVHRIVRSCSNWKNVHLSILKAKTLLENNQYPSRFYEPIIEKSLNKIIQGKQESSESENGEEEPEQEFKMIFVQYRGRITENFEKSLNRCNTPCKVIMTLKKMQSVLPSLKPSLEKPLKSGIVYKIECLRCLSCYVGQTSRHLLTRMKEHQKIQSPVGSHFMKCEVAVTVDNIAIVASSTKSMAHLMTLEALMINSIKPSINTKDEYRSRALTIKL